MLLPNSQMATLILACELCSGSSKTTAHREDEIFGCGSHLILESGELWCGCRCYTDQFGMSTATSLNLRAVLKTAVARSGMDVPARVVSGLTNSQKRCSSRPLLKLNRMM